MPAKQPQTAPGTEPRPDSASSTAGSDEKPPLRPQTPVSEVLGGKCFKLTCHSRSRANVAEQAVEVHPASPFGGPEVPSNFPLLALRPASSLRLFGPINPRP